MPCPRLPVVCLALLCLFPSRARGTEYQDYRIPDHHWSVWSANLSGSGDRQQTTNDPNSRNTQGILTLVGQSRVLWGRDSDTEQHSVSFAAQGDGSRRGTFSSAGAPLTGESRNRTRELREQLTLSAAWVFYPYDAALGWSASGALQSEYVQAWLSSSNRAFNPPAEQRSAFDAHGGLTRYRSNATFGPVLGRVRDATPVVDAQLLEERLAKSGSLTKPLSSTARAKVAQLLALRPRVRFAHDRPERWFWREVERVLQEDGAIGTQGLDAFTMLRLLEAANPPAAPRFVGQAFRVFVTLDAFREHASQTHHTTSMTLDHDTLVSSFTSPGEFHQRNRFDFTGIGYLAEFHRPLGMRGQVDAVQQLRWFDRSGALDLIHQIRASWSLSDRWSVLSQWDAVAQSRDRAGSRKFAAWALMHTASAQYRLEDAWAVFLRWQDVQDHGRNRFMRDDRFDLGVSYQFLGRLTAPGTIEPMRLEPARP